MPDNKGSTAQQNPKQSAPAHTGQKPGQSQDRGSDTSSKSGSHKDAIGSQNKAAAAKPDSQAWRDTTRDGEKQEKDAGNSGRSAQSKASRQPEPPEDTAGQRTDDDES